MGRLLKLAAALAALTLLAGLAGCQTLNTGTLAMPTWDHVAGLTVGLNSPGNAASGGTFVFNVTVAGGTGPYTVKYDFNSCVTPASTTHSNVAGTTDSYTATFNTVSSDTSCTLTVTVTDSANHTGTRTRTFTVHAVAANANPTITATADNATCSVSVTVADTDNDPVTVAVTTLPAAFGSTPPASQTSAAGGGTLTFTFSTADVLNGGSGDITFTATDGAGGSATATATLNCGGVTLAADTLYAIPSTGTAATGAQVTITVATGTPANPFAYLSGCRVLAPAASGFAYVANSFNVGAAGGAAGDVDGFWTNMSPAPSGFLLPPDNFITPNNVSGQTAYDFNVTPLGASNITTGSGALFNFQATFTTAGTYQLGFQQTETVDRTYYNDVSLSPNFFWGDITNLHSGVPSSITVQ